MTISEFKDEQIIYIWHRLNECGDTFVKGYTSEDTPEFVDYNEDYIENRHVVWHIFNNEARRRGLDPETFHLR